MCCRDESNVSAGILGRIGFAGDGVSVMETKWECMALSDVSSKMDGIIDCIGQNLAVLSE